MLSQQDTPGRHCTFHDVAMPLPGCNLAVAAPRFDVGRVCNTL
jgi:hypothetical protein